jgi:branched-chain amino acid aminotransferase
MDRWTYINDSFVTEANAQLHISDLAIQRGYGIFDYLKTINNRPVFLEEHLQRFYYSAEQMHLPIHLSPAALSNIIHELIQRNNIGTSGIRLTVTGGYSPDGYNISSPNLIITQLPLNLPSIAVFEKGIHLATYEHLRTLPHVKSINYAMAVWLQPHLRKQGADDVLYHLKGVISECPRANVFMVKDGVVITPDSNILLGITRQKLITLAKQKYTVEERPVLVEELQDCQEVFITSTTKQVLPVTTINGQPIANGKPGPVTQQLYNALVELQKK